MMVMSIKEGDRLFSVTPSDEMRQQAQIEVQEIWFKLLYMITFFFLL